MKAYTDLKAQNKNFEVVAVSLDQGKAGWEAAVKQDGMPWIHVCGMKGWQNEVAVKTVLLLCRKTCSLIPKVLS